ncbi:MAG: hypothetical protein KDA51_01425, partial [Planctomycetales bacterium]|nr:hypothetical protein [Planctomycetales bacterium]
IGFQPVIAEITGWKPMPLSKSDSYFPHDAKDKSHAKAQRREDAKHFNADTLRALRLCMRYVF